MNRLKWIASTTGALALAGGIAGVSLAEASPTASPAASSNAADKSSSAGAVQQTTSANATLSTQSTAAAHTASSPAASASHSSAASSSSAAAAASAISLSTWAGLLLPINNEGQLSGKDAKVISPAKLTSPWLTQTSAGLQFWAPAGAATTPGSTHSRTELESAIKYKVGTQKHVLSATLQILQLPKNNPEICVAQLHAGGSTGSDPFVMFDFKQGKLYVMVASGTSVAASFYTLLTNVPLDTSLTYRVADNGNGTLAIGAVSGSQSKSYTVAIPSVLRGASGHFSAGDYQQGTVSEGATDGGKVLFTALTQS